MAGKTDHRSLAPARRVKPAWVNDRRTRSIAHTKLGNLRFEQVDFWHVENWPNCFSRVSLHVHRKFFHQTLCKLGDAVMHYMGGFSTLLLRSIEDCQQFAESTQDNVFLQLHHVSFWLTLPP